MIQVLQGFFDSSNGVLYEFIFSTSAAVFVVAVAFRGCRVCGDGALGFGAWGSGVQGGARVRFESLGSGGLLYCCHRCLAGGGKQRSG